MDGRRGQLTVLAGVPGVGTSTLALGLARHAALRCGLPALFMAPDSAEREVRVRLIAAGAPVPATHLRQARLGPGEEEKLRRWRSALETAPLIISADWLRTEPLALDDAVGDYTRMVDLAVVDATPDDAAVVRGPKVVA